jgi:hypothetical protein
MFHKVAVISSAYPPVPSFFALFRVGPCNGHEKDNLTRPVTTLSFMVRKSLSASKTIFCGHVAQSCAASCVFESCALKTQFLARAQDM